MDFISALGGIFITAFGIGALGGVISIFARYLIHAGPNRSAKGISTGSELLKRTLDQVQMGQVVGTAYQVRALAEGEGSREDRVLLTQLADRLAAIEERFPSASDIDKIASVNDAILATKIDAIEATLIRLEKRIDDQVLNRWDVALVVFAVIGSTGVLAGIIFAAANFLSRK